MNFLRSVDAPIQNEILCILFLSFIFQLALSVTFSLKSVEKKNLYWSLVYCLKPFLIYFLFSLEMQELKIRPLPIVFAVFSSGLKACMYKVLQVMFGNIVHSILFGCALIFLPISLLGNYCFLNLCPHLSLNQWMVCLYCCERNSLWFSLFSPDYWSEVWRRSKFGMFLYMLVEIIFSTWLLL